MKLHSVAKKIICVFVFEIIVYFLAYALEPYVIKYFHIGGGWLTGGWMFGEVMGAWVNLLVIPGLTFLVMCFFVKEPWYWLLWIPVYFLVKNIYYPDGFYLHAFGYGNIHVDSVAITILVVQYFVWFVLKVAKVIRCLGKHKKK